MSDMKTQRYPGLKSPVSKPRPQRPATGLREDEAAFEADTSPPKLRRHMILQQAKMEGLIGAQKNKRISGRVSAALLNAAKKRSALTSDNDVIEYALARLAVEENYGERLFRHEGKVPQDLDLEF